MTTIFDELRKDHDIQRELLDKLTDTEGATEKRLNTFKTLKENLELHAKFEERALYNPMLQLDNTQPKARHSIAEHKEIDDYIEELEATDMSSPAWLVKAKKLAHRVNHHLDEEENEIFKSAGHAFTEKQKQSQGKEYKEAMKETR
jgi:hypothetical protein